ncbi:ABC transporter permease [Paenibacillus ginsengarvi]|uniref:Sugar ABC transporter permease n=1 Tax=Paenibacillus ginsengarvi TaxID=400777 RepID=A0A3B0CMS0_9BACL|nr:ABC transporter permease subunit [Paenibacillus ginsengarvi]RKN85804.1 sugar ABC transporter permease [Paenibacillus ginsengarvi]
MKTHTAVSPPGKPDRTALSRIRARIWRDRYLLLLGLPGLAYFLVYKYAPMFGLYLAFIDFNPFQGIFGSDFVGLEHFKRIFSDSEVLRVLWNTLYMSFLQIVFAFPMPILLALMLNEIRNQVYKRVVQSIIYLPHFLSWVVVVGIWIIFFRGEGIVNLFLRDVFGWNSIPFLTDPSFFKPMIVTQVIWKEAGWGTIIFLAALAGVNPSLYEAAVVDGASRMRQIWHITLPAIRSTIVIMLILRLGTVMDSGFEQVFLMLNPLNEDTQNVLDTFVFYKGIQQADYSFATAVGLFKGFVGLVLVMSANRLAKKFGEDGVY